MEWPAVLEELIASGTTQAGIAKQLGVKQQTVSGWLTRRAWPEPENIHSLACEYGYNEDALAGAVQRSRVAGVERPRNTQERLADLEAGLTELRAQMTELAHQKRQRRPGGTPSADGPPQDPPPSD
jgi:transcriptional regulator with XRE-family HTH domain